jgi:hypothetical protein
MPPLIDLAGETFGLWTVLHRDSTNTRNEHPKWICACQCGTWRSISGSDLRSGKSTNCGCKKATNLGDRSRTHGKSRTKIYIAWCGIINRCYDPKSDFFYRYGGRGIKMCDRWRNSFEAFLADMGEPPTAKHSIDRIDNDGNYEPSNCRWQAPQKQMSNQTRTIRVIVNGEETSLMNACKLKGLDYLNIYRRMKKYGISAQHLIDS